MRTWSARSTARLATCHPLLRELMTRALADPALPHDLTILCGHRDINAQEAAWMSGASKLHWPESAHNSTPSLAVDVAPIVDDAVSWDWPRYHEIAPVIKATWAGMEAEGLTAGWALTWGGDWPRFPDGPHWELRKA